MNNGSYSTQNSLDMKLEVPPSDTSSSTSSPTNDYENNVKFPVPGWPLLAKTIAEHPDLEAFPTFADLSIKSLLYYQAELISLRQKLHKAEWKDFRHPDEPRNKARYFAANLHLFISARDKALKKKEEPPEQWILIEKIRTTLEKYNDTLLQFSNVAALREADNCNIRTLKEYVKELQTSVGGVTSTGSRTWGELSEIPPLPKTLPELVWGLGTGFFVPPDDKRNEIDSVFQENLIVPHKVDKQDGLTQWVKFSFIPFYAHMRNYYFVPAWKCVVSPRQTLFPPKDQGHDEEKRSPSVTSTEAPLSPVPSDTPSNSTNVSGSTIANDLTTYPGEWIVGVTSVMTTVVACLLPVVAITVLARVHTMGLILGLIAVFTAIFSIGLVLLSSSSSRVEIFTATAAFSAVMVVFVQNQIGAQ